MSWRPTAAQITRLPTTSEPNRLPIALRSGRPAWEQAPPRLRASDLDHRELPEWLQREAEQHRAAPWGRAILATALAAAAVLVAGWLI